jgi:uncharacterized protein (DUF486 family)
MITHSTSIHSVLHTKATEELKHLINLYTKILPIWTFPFIPLIIAAFFQSLAWMSGPNLFQHLSLLPRLLMMLLFACGEYLFMMPAMNAGIEIFGMREALLVVIYQITTLVVFMIVDLFIFKKPFKIKYAVSFFLLALAIYIIYMYD